MIRNKLVYQINTHQLTAGLGFPAWAFVAVPVPVNVWVETDEAGRIGVGAVDAPEDEGKIADKGRVPPAFGVSALGLIAVATPATACGANF